MKFAPQSFLAHHAPSKPFPFISFADPAFQLLSFHIVAKTGEGVPSGRSFSIPLLTHFFRAKSNHFHSCEKTPGVGTPRRFPLWNPYRRGICCSRQCDSFSRLSRPSLGQGARLARRSFSEKEESTFDFRLSTFDFRLSTFDFRPSSCWATSFSYNTYGAYQHSPPRGSLDPSPHLS